MQARLDGTLDTLSSFGEGLLTSAKDITMIDLMLSAGFVYTVLKIGAHSTALYQSLTSRHMPNEIEKEAILMERESALELYREAQISLTSESLGSAFITINAALSDFNRTLQAKPSVATLRSNQKINAKLRYFRAQIHYLQGDHVQAEKDLLDAINLDYSLVQAHNLLAHLYLHQLHNLDKAQKYLTQSLHLNKDQLFARFYSALLKDNLASVDALAEEIFSIYHRQAETNDASLLTRLHDTTPALTIPYLLVKWLDGKMEHANQPQPLLNIANTIKTLLDEHPHLGTKALRTMLKEGRIKALLKVADLKDQALVFTKDEQQLRDNMCLKVVGDDEQHKYYFNYTGEHLDFNVSQLFPLGTRTDYLLEEQYHDVMLSIMDAWTKHGLLHCHENMTVADFVQQHVEGMGWKPWLISLIIDHKTISLLNISCAKQGVNLAVYVNDEQHQSCMQTVFQRVITQNQERVLRVRYDESTHSLTLLKSVATPSEMYRTLAMHESLNLVKYDDADNAYVLTLLGESGLAIIPQLVRARLSDPKATNATQSAALGALTAFIKHHRGENQDDKVLAELIYADYMKAKHTTTSGRFFTKKSFIIGGLAVATVVAGMAYGASKE